MRTHTGFTLIELMVTVAIAALLLTVAIPSFRSILQNSRLATQANEFVTATTLARSEASRRSVSVFVTALDASTATNEWGPGWRVWVDLDGDGSYDAGEELRTFAALPAGMTLDSTGGVSQYEFRATGFLAGGTDTLQLRIPNCTGEAARDIQLIATGRANVSRVACP
jgi:type IV fimbrial biogenesis protein FimT